MEWAYGVTTVAERFHSTLPKTLASLAAAGFDRPRLFIDGAGPQLVQWYVDEFSLPVSPRLPRIGLAANWCLSAVELYLYQPMADRYAIFQDDVLACRNLRAYLEACPYPERGYLNLFTFLDNEQLVKHAVDGWLEGSEMVGRKAQTYHGRRQQAGRGALALVFDREALVTLLTSSHLVRRPQLGIQSAAKIDGGIVEAMNQAGYREFVHRPSLVSHVGYCSTKSGVKWHSNAKTFRGEEFDAMSLLKKTEPAAVPYHPTCRRSAAVTCYFNPHNGQARRRCFATFSRQFPRIGLDLFVAEGSVDDRWEVPDGPNVWRFAMDPDAHLFCKENLLNLAIARLPDRFDRVLWIDADVVILSPNYADRLAEALDRHVTVQGLSELQYIDADGKSETGWRMTVAFHNMKRGTRNASCGKSYPGLAWAAARELLTNVGGLYDRVITGGGDNVWTAACYGGTKIGYMYNWSAPLITDVLRYGAKVAPLVSSVGYVLSRGIHLYHGHIANRQYMFRNRILREIEFDPNLHLEYAPNGTLRWSAAAPEKLREAVRAYMHGRKEDEE